MSVAENIKVSRQPLCEHRVLAVMRERLASGARVRVTPAIFTSEAKIHYLVEVFRQVTAYVPKSQAVLTASLL